MVRVAFLFLKDTENFTALSNAVDLTWHAAANCFGSAEKPKCSHTTDGRAQSWKDKQKLVGGHKNAH
jgi:hypothetical protein